VEIKHIQEKIGITTISVTHDQEEALVMSDLVCVMNEGKIEQVATPREIYQHPKNEFVAKFIGEINLIRGQIRSQNEDEIEVAIDGDTEKQLFVENTWSNLLTNNHVFVAIRPEHIYLVND